MCHPISEQDAEHCCDVLRTSGSNSAPVRGSLESRQQGRDSRAILAPFVVQRGNHLFFLASEATGWIVAELRFDAVTCTYVEIRRMRYEWPREAFGSLLSRVAVAGEVDPRAVDETSQDFARWLSAQFRVRHGDIVPSA